jgi:hypothetical protein
MYNIVHLFIIYKYILFDITVYLLRRELTMVDLLVYTKHMMGDMYYNTPFAHNVLSIVTVLIFF